MDFSRYSGIPVQIAVDLVNTLDPIDGSDALASPSDVGDFANRYATVWPHPDWEVTEADLHEVRALRSRLRKVFEAEDIGVAAQELNTVLADSSATPRVSLHHDVPHLHFESMQATPVRWLGATAAMGLSTLLCDNGMERFGVCDSNSCADVFIDTSRNKSRRRCSDTCATRENVAAYRKRQSDDT